MDTLGQLCRRTLAGPIRRVGGGILPACALRRTALAVCRGFQEHQEVEVHGRDGSPKRLGDPLDGETEYLYRPSINNGRLPAYFRLDLAAVRRFDLLGADWHLRLQVYNVTNRRNVIARHYLPADEGMVVQSRRGLPLLPLFELGMEL